MEEGSEKAGLVSGPVRTAMREGKTSADQIIAGRRATTDHRRAQGVKGGFYAVRCDLCGGAGTVRFGTRPLEICIKCDGAGALIIRDLVAEERLAITKGILFFMAAAFIAVCVGVFAALAHQNHWWGF